MLIGICGRAMHWASSSVPIRCWLGFGWLEPWMIDPRKTACFHLINLVVLCPQTKHAFLTSLFIFAKSLCSLFIACTIALQFFRLLKFCNHQNRQNRTTRAHNKPKSCFFALLSSLFHSYFIYSYLLPSYHVLFGAQSEIRQVWNIIHNTNQLFMNKHKSFNSFCLSY